MGKAIHISKAKTLRPLIRTLTCPKAIKMAAEDVKPLMTGNEMNCTMNPVKEKHVIVVFEIS